MHLHLKICELDFSLKLTNVCMTTDDENWSRNWCDVKLSLCSEYINYNDEGELLLSGEVLHIRDTLKELVDGTITKTEKFKSCEPDLGMKFIPSKRFDDIHCEFIVHFWDGREPRNRVVTRFDRQEIEALYVYLRLVTGEIDRNDDAVVKLINAQVLVEE